MLEGLEQAAGVRVPRVRVIGGGARNDRWLQIKTAVSRCPLELAETGEAVALGAALIAGIASGTYASLADALRCAAPSRTLAVEPGLRRRYARAYQAWVAAADRSAAG
jgi:xylulokinase